MSGLNRTAKMMASGLMAMAILAAGATSVSAQQLQTNTFSGAKVNGGSATFARNGSVRTLTLSADFKVPDTPDPHWQVVDSRGQVYLLQKLTVRGPAGGVLPDRTNTTITLPAYVRDVARVQIYCSWAEALLGEASFRAPVGGSTE